MIFYKCFLNNEKINFLVGNIALILIHKEVNNMQYQENVRIQSFRDESGKKYGRIKLQCIADPATVVVSLCGQRLYPLKFNCFGWPIFSEEVCNLFDWKEKSLKRTYGKDYKLTTLVTYDSAEVNINLYEINSLDGIIGGTKNLKAFNKLLRDRVIYSKSFGKGKLQKYVVFGRYMLDADGRIFMLEEVNENFKMPTVCTYRYFEKQYHGMGYSENISWKTGCSIPSYGDSCPWCTKAFTIKDVKTGAFDTINGKIAHSECAKQYKLEREINYIINEIMERIYEDGLSYELIPCEDTMEECYEIKPWFLCHTPDGDIKIGSIKGGISIEWQDNFKQFDMNIFEGENVTKWQRGIYAWGQNNAYQFIKGVKDLISSNSRS